MSSRIFIGSSTEGLAIAKAIKENLQSNNIEITIWNENAFQPGKFHLENLLDNLSKNDFAIFIFSHDDAIKMRNKNYFVTRDNVIFELGLAIAKLGREHVFFVAAKDDTLKNKKFHLPSDLAGITYGKYDLTCSNNWKVALEAFCNSLKRRIKEVETNRKPEDIFNDIVEQMRELLSTHLNTNYIGEFPDFFETSICQCINRAEKEVFIACDFPAYGSFSKPEIYEKYLELLKNKRSKGVEVKVIMLNEKGRKELNALQFAQSEEQWKSLQENKSFIDKLEKFRLRSSRKIINQKDFFEALTKHQNFAATNLITKYADTVTELSSIMPIYIWIADEKNAVFSIPTFGEYSVEHGFETKDKNLIKALRSIWNRYNKSR